MREWRSIREWRRIMVSTLVIIIIGIITRTDRDPFRNRVRDRDSNGHS
jgi:hypothetical protein